MLRISTDRNQSTKVRGGIYFNVKNIITKLSQDVIQYYMNITSPGGVNTRRYISIKSTKGAHELQKGNSRAEQGVLKEKDPGQSTANLLHYHYVTQIGD